MNRQRSGFRLCLVTSHRVGADRARRQAFRFHRELLRARIAIEVGTGSRVGYFSDLKCVLVRVRLDRAREVATEVIGDPSAYDV